MDRNETVIPMRSLTHAIKAKKLLQEYGIEARVVKPDARNTEKGCGYGIAVFSERYERSKKILKENGLPPLNP